MPWLLLDFLIEMLGRRHEYSILSSPFLVHTFFSFSFLFHNFCALRSNFLVCLARGVLGHIG